jgi:putative ABC transport system substrate-binding protein
MLLAIWNIHAATAVRVAVLINPTNPANTSSTLTEVEAVARALGLQVEFFKANTSREIDSAFATLVRERSDALLVAGDGFFTSRRVQLAALAARLRPTRRVILPKSVD